MSANQMRWVVLPLCGVMFACSGGCSCDADNGSRENDSERQETEFPLDAEIVEGDAITEHNDDSDNNMTDTDSVPLSCEPRTPCLLSLPPTDNAAIGITIHGTRIGYINQSSGWSTFEINREFTIINEHTYSRDVIPVSCEPVQGAEYMFINAPSIHSSNAAYLCVHKHSENGRLHTVDTRPAIFDLQSAGVEFPPTKNVGLKYDLQLSMNYLIWSFGFNLYAYDRSEKTVFAFATEPDDYGFEPNLDNGFVVFVRGYEKTQEIWIANLNAGQKTRLTDDNVLQKWPNISGDRIVWVDTRDGEWYPDATYSNSNLYLHTLSSGDTVRITDDPSDQEDPWIDGDLVVWTDLRHGGRTANFGYDEAEIYLKDLRNGGEYRVSNMPGNDFKPQISGTAVIWLHETVPGDRWSHDLYYMDVAHLLEDPADGG